ncbi:MAG: flippase [Acidobacteriaceae bacterium]|nr:flippase [Acidobacteriaceae bacterium]
MKVTAQAPAVRSLAANFFLLTGGEMAAKVLGFITFSYLARVLGAARYGSLEFVLAVMMLFTLPSEMGLGSYGARELAGGKRDVQTLFREILQIRVLLAAVCFLLLIGFVLILPKSPGVKLLLCAYGGSLLLTPLLLQWLFQSRDEMQWVALASIVRQSVLAAMVLLFARPSMPLFTLGAFELASVSATALFCLAVMRFRFRLSASWQTPQPARMRAHLAQSLPIGGAEMAWACMWYFATVLLGLAFSDESLGWFSAAHRLLMALHTFVWLYFFNLLPSMSRTTHLERSHLLGLLGRSLRVAAWSSFLVALTLTLSARTVLTIVYGPLFRDAAPLLAILAWMLPVAMLSGHHRYVLIAYSQQKALLWTTVVSAIAAVGAGCVLVPQLGSVGAALALLFANVLNLLLVDFAAQKYVVRIPIMQELYRPLIALCAAGLVARALALGDVLRCLAAVVVYVAVFALTEWRSVLSLVVRLAPRVRESFAR